MQTALLSCRAFVSWVPRAYYALTYPKMRKTLGPASSLQPCCKLQATGTKSYTRLITLSLSLSPSLSPPSCSRTHHTQKHTYTHVYTHRTLPCTASFVPLPHLSARSCSNVSCPTLVSRNSWSSHQRFVRVASQALQSENPSAMIKHQKSWIHVMLKFGL